MTYDQADIGAMLPLQTAALHILLALSAGEAHGYGIIHAVEAQTNGGLRLSPGTLYRTIQRLLDEGLIQEPRRLSSPGEDPRRRYYRITPFGLSVARAETRRLAELVRLATGALRVAESS